MSDSLSFETTPPLDHPAPRTVPEDSPIPSASEVRDNPLTSVFSGPKVRGRRRGEERKVAPGKPKSRKPTPPKRRGSLRQPLEDFYTLIGALVTPVDQVCGSAVVNAAPKCAETLDELAYQNDAVRRALVSLTTTSSVGAVFAAHIPIVLAIGVHHVPAVKNTMGRFGADIAQRIQESTNEAPTPHAEDAAA